jgi:hypothetical protein
MMMNNRVMLLLQIAFETLPVQFCEPVGTRTTSFCDYYIIFEFGF